MNKIISNALLIGAVALGVTGCKENSWNDHYLDGFESGVDYESSKEEGSVTLTADQYQSISKTLQALAADDASLKQEAKAISANECFDKSSAYPAQIAIPYFLDTTSNPYYYANNGSTVDVTYDECDALPSQYNGLKSAETRTISNDEYATVWGSPTAYIKSFAPAKTAESQLPGLLTTAYPDAAEGNYAIVTYNVAQTDPTFGYPSAEDTPSTATLYTESTFEAGKYCIVDVPGSRAAMDLTGKTYGYFTPETVSIKDNSFTVFNDAATIWNFVGTGTTGEYYLTDNSGRYYYNSGTYKNFNVVANLDNVNDGYIWIVTSESDNLWKIQNKLTGRWIQTPNSYGTFGCYDYVETACPALFKIETSDPVEIPLFTPASTTRNAAYYFNGTKWAVASDTYVLQPEDYTAMGLANNKLVEPEHFLPIFLKNKYPYAMSGDQLYVVYNGKQVSLMVYDGSTWAINDNARETVTGRFEKKNGQWQFVKYIGKAIYDEYTADEIALDRSYAFVSGNSCATPIGKNDNYGYIYPTSVSIKDGQFIASSDANAFKFCSAYETDEKNVAAPEGKFLIQDTYGRYLYLSGTYSSFNVKKVPDMTDDNISDAFLWTATRTEEGLWEIKCTRGEENVRFVSFSSGYGNFAAYATLSATDTLPSLYILSE